MKSYELQFVYQKENVLSERRLFVMRENDSAVDGIELTYLTPEEEKEVKELLKDHEVGSSFGRGEPIEGYKPEWGRAWRRYNKMSFANKEDEEDGKEN